MEPLSLVGRGLDRIRALCPGLGGVVVLHQLPNQDVGVQSLHAPPFLRPTPDRFGHGLDRDGLAPLAVQYPGELPEVGGGGLQDHLGPLEDEFEPISGTSPRNSRTRLGIAVWPFVVKVEVGMCSSC